MTDRSGARVSEEPGPDLPPEARALLEARAPLALPQPAYGGRSLPNVATSVVRALGGEPSEAAVGPLSAEVDPFGGNRAEGPVLLCVIDGLGYQRLLASAARRDGALARSWLARAAPLTSVFPTTTTVALASLSTAAPPARHGVVGFRQYLPAFGSVVEVLRQTPLGVASDDSLVGNAWGPELLLAVPTIFRRGVSGAVAVSRDRFQGHGFTRAIYDGASYAPYAGWADWAAALAHVLAKEAPPPLVMAYWDELDTVQHLQGPDAAAVDLEIDRLASLFDFVARAAGPDRAKATTVLITADHGLVPSDPGLQLQIDQHPELLRCLARPPTGDRRVALLKARAGEVDRLRGTLERLLPPGGRILRSDDAVRGGLFGPPPYFPDLAEAVGDLVVLVPSPGGILYTLPGRTVARRPIIGAHGGLEPAELLVPLVRGQLADFHPAGPRG